jgi:hypothetical protein
LAITHLFFAKAQTACLHLFRSGTAELVKIRQEEDD